MNLPSFVPPVEPHISLVCFGDHGWEAKGGGDETFWVFFFRFHVFIMVTIGYRAISWQSNMVLYHSCRNFDSKKIRINLFL